MLPRLVSGNSSNYCDDREHGVPEAVLGNSPVSVCVSTADPSIEIDPCSILSIIQNANNSVQSIFFKKKVCIEYELEMGLPMAVGSNFTLRNPDLSSQGKRMVLVDADALKPMRLFLEAREPGVNYFFFCRRTMPRLRNLFSRVGKI
uniref:Uncharacterized protein n=1 Tax=Corethron hystrix TaxID=216773 RepID=A0A7S1BW10_9STRA